MTESAPRSAPRDTPPDTVLATDLTRHAGIEVPLICGAMYPCSNPELVAAVSRAGGLGVLQPISLTYVHGHEFRAGIRLMNQLSGGRPLGMNALIEASSKTYRKRMEDWVDVALEEGVRVVDASTGGLGGCPYAESATGNLATEDLVWMLDGLGVATGVDLPSLVDTSTWMAGHLGRPSPSRVVRALGG